MHSSPYGRLEHIAFIVKPISVIVRQYFPVTGSLIWLNQGKPHHPTVEWMNQSQILLSPLSTLRNTLNRQLSVTFRIFVSRLKLTSIRTSFTLTVPWLSKANRAGHNISSTVLEENQIKNADHEMWWNLTK